MIYLRLFFEFFKVGLFSVGGGLATIPFLTDKGLRTGWFTSGDLANMIAVSESTPGPIGVNMSTFVGYTHQGIPGAIMATLSLVFPSLVVIMIIAKALDKYQKNQRVQDAFAFMRPAVTGLIAAAGFSVLKIALLKEGEGFFASINWIAVAMFVIVFILTQLKQLKKIHPVAFIGLGAVVGILLRM